MRVEEFRKKTDAELLQMADACFIEIEGTGGVGGAPAPWEFQPALLLQAQFYMNEVDRRHDAKIVRRDFVLELVIIGLILLELLFGIHEGSSQADILAKVDKSTSATATTIAQLQGVEQQTLTEQKQSLQSLNQMNYHLQTSLKETSDMATAAQKQLTILQDEQASRLAEAAKKPNLQLFSGTLLLTTQVPVLFSPREQSDTKMTFDLSLRNAGDAPARNGLLRIIVLAKDVQLECSASFERAYQAPDSTTHVILVPFQLIRPGVVIPMSVTATYPKGQTAFSIMFNADADEIATGTVLGVVNFTPPNTPQ